MGMSGEKAHAPNKWDALIRMRWRKGGKNLGGITELMRHKEILRKNKSLAEEAGQINQFYFKSLQFSGS